eukprot:10226399-Heterocapsa_arctica.AAC.1
MLFARIGGPGSGPTHIAAREPPVLLDQDEHSVLALLVVDLARHTDGLAQTLVTRRSQHLCHQVRHVLPTRDFDHGKPSFPQL